MPPWSLHHLIIPLTESPISWSRPGEPEKPRSSPYPIWIAVSVTPVSVTPLALPGPHGDASVPNMFPAGAEVVAAAAPPVGAAVVDDELPRLLLHAATTARLTAVTT